MAAVAVLSLRSLNTLCGLPPFGSLGLELNTLAPFEDRPPPLKNPYTENPDTENPYTENPYTENPDTENPYTDKGDKVCYARIKKKRAGVNPLFIWPATRL